MTMPPPRPVRAPRRPAPKEPAAIQRVVSRIVMSRRIVADPRVGRRFDRGAAAALLDVSERAEPLAKLLVHGGGDRLLAFLARGRGLVGRKPLLMRDPL